MRLSRDAKIAFIFAQGALDTSIKAIDGLDAWLKDDPIGLKRECSKSRKKLNTNLHTN